MRHPENCWWNTLPCPWHFCLILLVLGCSTVANAQQTRPSIRLVKNDDGVYQFVAQADWIAKHQPRKTESNEAVFLRQRFYVKVGQNSADDDPAVLGTIRRQENALTFVPRFRFQPGVTYMVVLHSADGKRLLKSKTFSIPKKTSQPTKVTGIYPSGNKLPDNLLRMYVVFSAPMKKGDIYEHLTIRESGGRKVELPFLEIEQELWSPDGKRLTLLLDPGRIKRGLKPREEMGPILVAGKKYEFRISGKWLDANGIALGKDVIKSFIAAQTDDRQPDPKRWKLHRPAAATKSKLRIDLNKALDYGMLNRVIFIEDPDGNELKGSVSLADHQTSWKFSPAAAWKPGKYQVVIDNRLEDVCGNSIEKVFDVDVFNKTQALTTKLTRIEFEVK